MKFKPSDCMLTIDNPKTGKKIKIEPCNINFLQVNYTRKKK